MPRGRESGPVDEYYDKLLKLIGPFGYDTPAERTGPVKDAMRRYNKRRKELLKQIQDTGLESMGHDRRQTSHNYIS